MGEDVPNLAKLHVALCSTCPTPADGRDRSRMDQNDSVDGLYDNAKSLYDKATRYKDLLLNATVQWITSEHHPEKGVSLHTKGKATLGQWYKTKTDASLPNGHKDVTDIWLVPSYESPTTSSATSLNLQDQVSGNGEGYAASFILYGKDDEILTTLYVPMLNINDTDIAKSLQYGYNEDRKVFIAPGTYGFAPLQATLQSAINKLFSKAKECPFQLFSPGTYNEAFRKHGKERCDARGKK